MPFQSPQPRNLLRALQHAQILTLGAAHGVVADQHEGGAALDPVGFAVLGAGLEGFDQCLHLGQALGRVAVGHIAADDGAGAGEDALFLLAEEVHFIVRAYKGDIAGEDIEHGGQLLGGENIEDRMMQTTLDTVDKLVERGVPCNKIAILVRSNRNIQDIAEYFMNHSDYPLVSDEAFRLDASQAVCTLVNALYILVHPNDNIALATLNKFCDTYSVAGNMPEQLLTNRSEYLEMPLFDLTERLFAELKLGEIKDMIKQTAYICTFYDCLSKYLTDNSSDITGFLKEWDNRIHEKSIHSDGDGGIRFLTIHKSKGLEYDHVIMPYCDWQLEKANTIWCTPQEAPYNELPLVPIDFSAKLMKQSIYEADYNHEHLQNIVDNLNLLYVAFTRASHNLIVIGKRANSAYRSAIIESVLDKVASRLEANDVKMELTGIGSDAKTDDISFCYNEIYVPDSSKKSNEKKDTNVLSAFSQPLEIKINVTPAMPEFRQSNQSRDLIKRDETEEQQKFYIKMGTVLHNLFSTIRTADDIDGALKQLELDGLLYDLNLTPE